MLSLEKHPRKIEHSYQSIAMFERRYIFQTIVLVSILVFLMGCIFVKTQPKTQLGDCWMELWNVHERWNMDMEHAWNLGISLASKILDFVGQTHLPMCEKPHRGRNKRKQLWSNVVVNNQKQRPIKHIYLLKQT